MLDMIKEQYQSGNTLNQHKYHAIFKRHESHSVIHDLYPLGIEYYHELNPAFTFNVARSDYFEFCKAMTIKDGMVSFASFILNQFYNIPKYKTHFLIHTSLAPIVPHNLKDHFSCWTIQQSKKILPHEAKRVLIAGVGSDQTLGTPDQIRERLMILKGLPKEIEVDLYLPVRKNPHGNWKETYITYQVIEMIKEILPESKLNYIQAQTLLEIPSFRHVYFLDLIPDTFVIADSFLSYLVASRGGTVSSFNEAETPKKIFELDLSLHHKLQLSALPEVNSIFADLIFYKKQSGLTDLMSDQGFLNIIKKG